MMISIISTINTDLVLRFNSEKCIQVTFSVCHLWALSYEPKTRNFGLEVMGKRTIRRSSG